MSAAIRAGRASVASGAFALLLAVTACTATDRRDTTPSPTADTPREATNATEVLTLSPIQQFWDEVYGVSGPEEREQSNRDARTDVQNRIAACMREAGFPYEPYTVSVGGSPGADAEGITDADREDPAWVERWGYGAVHHPGRESTTRPGSDDTVGIPIEDDPNHVYLMTLSASEAEAYRRALWGPSTPAEQPEGGALSAADVGCARAAEAAVQGVDPRFESLIAGMNELTADYPWPEITALDAKWAACMSAHGRAGFVSPEEARASVDARVNALWERADPAAAATPTPPADAELERAAADERELALVDLGCREEVRYWPRQGAIWAAVQNAYMDDHRVEFEAMRAAYEQRAGS